MVCVSPGGGVSLSETVSARPIVAVKSLRVLYMHGLREIHKSINSNFFQIKDMFFVKVDRKPYAKIQLATLSITSDDPERSKHAKQEVVYLGLICQGHLKSTLVERAKAIFYGTMIVNFRYLAPFLNSEISAT